MGFFGGKHSSFRSPWLPTIESFIKLSGQVLLGFVLTCRLPMWLFGTFAWVSTLVGLVTVLSSGAFDTLIATRAARLSHFVPLHASVLILRWALVLLFAPIFAAIPLIAKMPFHTPLYILGCLGIPLTFFVDQSDLFLISQGIFSQYRIRIALSVFANIIRLWLAWVWADIVGLAVVSLCETILLAIWYAKMIPIIRPQFRYWRIPRILRATTMHLWVANALGSFFFRVDHFLVQLIMGPQVYALYAFAYRFFDAAMTVAQTIVRVDITRYFSGFISIHTLIVRPVAVVGVCAFGGTCTLMLLTHTTHIPYQASLPVFLISILSLYACIFGMIRGSIYARHNLTFYDVQNSIIGIVVLIPLSIFAQKQFGLMGAAWAFATACCVSGVLSTSWNSRGRVVLIEHWYRSREK